MPPQAKRGSPSEPAGRLSPEDRPTHQRWGRDEFEVDTDPARLDLDVVHGYLQRSYWAEGIPRRTVEASVRRSLCFGLYRGGEQIGFARVISDRATFAWLCDVFVLEEWQGRGLGSWLVECVLAHPELQGLRRLLLATRDAHAVYRKLGFESLARPEAYMERRNRDLYRR